MTDTERIEDRTLQDRAYDLLGEMLIEQDTAQFLRELEEKQARGDMADIDAFSRRQDEKNLKKIAAYTRRQRFRHLVRHTLPRLVQAAAVVVAVFFLAGSIAVASSHTVRVKVMELLIHIEREYTTVSLTENEQASFDVPADWKGSSYLAYIPEEMEVFEYYSSINSSNVAYKSISDGTKILKFTEANVSAVTAIDTENATVENITINGNSGYIAVKENTIQIFWADGLHYYIVTTHGIDETTTIKVAQSIRII